MLLTSDIYCLRKWTTDPRTHSPSLIRIYLIKQNFSVDTPSIHVTVYGCTYLLEYTSLGTSKANPWADVLKLQNWQLLENLGLEKTPFYLFCFILNCLMFDLLQTVFTDFRLVQFCVRLPPLCSLCSFQNWNCIFSGWWLVLCEQIGAGDILCT